MSLFDVSVPVFKRTLTNLENLLKKGEAFAAEKGIEPSVLINARLAPDMFPLSRQVQIATDTARRGAGMLAGVDVPAAEDTEQTFAELYARIASTQAYLDGFTRDQFEGAESKTIELPMGETSLKLDAPTFLMAFAMANFLFHVTTAYNILRHNGVEIGKMDYLGAP